MADNTTTSYLSGILDKAKSIQERLDASQKKTNQLVKQQADTNVVYQPRKASTLYMESSRQNTRTSPYQSLINTAKTYDQFAYGSTEAAKKPLGYLGELSTNAKTQADKYKLISDTYNNYESVRLANAHIRNVQDRQKAEEQWLKDVQQNFSFGTLADYGLFSNAGIYPNAKNSLASNIKTYSNEDKQLTDVLNTIKDLSSSATKEQLASADWSGFTKLQEQLEDNKAKRQIYIDKYRSTGDATTLNFINQFSDAINKGITALGKELPAVLTSASSLASTKKGIQQSTLDTLEQMKLGKLIKEGKLKSLTQTEQAPNTMKQQILNRLAKVNKLSGSPSVVRPTPISQTRPA